MYLSHLKIKNHDILGDLEINFLNPRTNEPYRIIAFVGENGCGKTSLLNEIFNYTESTNIVDKEYESPIGFNNYFPLYLRQNSLAKNAMRETRKLIDNVDLFPIKSDFCRLGLSDISSPLVDLEKGTDILKNFHDGEILKMFLDDHLGEIHCAQDVTEKIDGEKHKYDISKYSSGQQEILLKLKDLKEFNSSIDSVLLDEPETSLHPRWQKQVITIIQNLLNAENSKSPQIFLATHSEKVLESLIGNNDALIVNLQKNKSKIEVETISEMDLRLPKPTFAELDYVVFHIPSMDYHDQLFTYFGAFFDKDTSTAIDLKIERKCEKIFGKKNFYEFFKERVNARFNKIYKTKMLPTYIRDYFHHPNEIEPPTEDELVKSIELLRKLIKFMSDNGVKEVEETD